MTERRPLRDCVQFHGLPSTEDQEGARSPGRSIEVQTECPTKETRPAGAGTGDIDSSNRTVSVGDRSLPALLTAVQVTCASLAERLKCELPAAQPDCNDTLSEVEPAAVVAAAQATRDLLGEVEMAFFSSGMRSKKPSLDTPASQCAGPISPKSWDWTEKEGMHPGTCAGTQWFCLSTPTRSEVDEASAPPSQRPSLTGSLTNWAAEVRRSDASCQSRAAVRAKAVG